MSKSNITKKQLISEFDEKVIELYIKGKSKEVIASELEVPLKEVKKVFKKPNLSEIVEETIRQKEMLLRSSSLEILEKILYEKVKNGEATAKELLSENRDILDVIDAINKLTKEQEKKRLGTSGGNIFVNIMNDLT